MMNYPGVVAGQADCMEKLALGADGPIDGHAPGLTGRDLCAYIAGGISSDHECTNVAEAREKLRLGMTIMIREGSQARDMDALIPLVTPDTVDRFVFVTDDRDVEDLLGEGHINYMVRKAVAAGISPVHAAKMASWNAAQHFRLAHLGAIAPGKMASFQRRRGSHTVQGTAYVPGRPTGCGGRHVRRTARGRLRKRQILRSSINVHWLELDQFHIPVPEGKSGEVHVIEVMEHRIDTKRTTARPPMVDGMLQADPEQDLAKVAIIERHQASGNIGLGFVRGFGLKRGALASSVGHDSHNLVVVGVNDEDMLAAAIDIVKARGGLTVVQDGQVLARVPLPIAGLMSDMVAHSLRDQLETLHAAAATLESKLRRPFMAMSFLSLSVIGDLKITDQGLVDVGRFELIDLFV